MRKHTKDIIAVIKFDSNFMSGEITCTNKVRMMALLKTMRKHLKKSIKREWERKKESGEITCRFSKFNSTECWLSVTIAVNKD